MILVILEDPDSIITRKDYRLTMYLKFYL